MNTNMASRYTARGQQRGFTLIELLVAMAIAGALMAGIVQVFIGSKATYRVVEDLSRIQENGRFVMDTVAWSVRMAGYRGCKSTSLNKPDNSLTNGDSSALYNFEFGIEGFDAVNRGFREAYLRNTLNAAITDAKNDQNMEIELIRPGSVPHDEPDVVIARAVFGNPTRLHPKNVGSGGDEGPFKWVEWWETIDKACPDGSDMHNGLCKNDIVMISDCNNSRIFQIQNFSQVNQSSGASGGSMNMGHGNKTSADPGNEEFRWGGFKPGAEIIKAGTRIYFVANLIENNQEIPSLFVLDETGRTELLSTNVEDMQVYYGVDTNPKGPMLRADERGWTATKVLDELGEDGWQQVVSAEIRLLMRSQNQFLSPDGTPQDYDFDGKKDIAPEAGDTRLRRQFANIVTIRNRALF